MKKMDEQQLIWSYLDNDISIEDKLIVDRMRESDSKFASNFHKAEQLHHSLSKLPLKEVSSEFALNLETTLLNEISSNRRRFNINPLFNFAILLIGLGIGFYFIGSQPTTAMSFNFESGINGLKHPLLTEALSAISNFHFELNWTYFVILVIAPFLYMWDKIAEQKFTLRQFVFV